MWTTDNDHGAQLQFHTGRHVLEGPVPDDRLVGPLRARLAQRRPAQFVVLGTPIADCCGGMGGHGASYLGPEHDGVQLAVDPKNPLPFASPGPDVFREEQAARVRPAGPAQPPLGASSTPTTRRSAPGSSPTSWPSACRRPCPRSCSFADEPARPRRSTAWTTTPTRPFGQHVPGGPAAGRARRPVRPVFHGSNGGAGAWDAHGGLRQNHAASCAQVDRPIAGLLKDLKQRGLLEETLVVWATEFGRTPAPQGGDGRDHHPYGFSVWLAGGGIKGGIAHGATDELGFHAVEDRHYVTDIHATVLHQLGLDPRRLEVPGHKRLEIDFGSPIRRDPGMKCQRQDFSQRRKDRKGRKSSQGVSGTYVSESTGFLDPSLHCVLACSLRLCVRRLPR